MFYYCTSQIKSINFLNGSQIKIISSYTVLNIKLNNIIDFVTT